MLAKKNEKLYNEKRGKSLKKHIGIIIFIFIMIILICFVGLHMNVQQKKNILQDNQQYEEYLADEIYGTNVVTLINKAMSNNEKNHVVKDEKGFYRNNNQNSILIDVVMITNEEKEETTTYKMEAISKVGVTEFIRNFNTVTFTCTKKEYHKQTGKIAYIELTQKTT